MESTPVSAFAMYKKKGLPLKGKHTKPKQIRKKKETLVPAAKNLKMPKKMDLTKEIIKVAKKLKEKPKVTKELKNIVKKKKMSKIHQQKSKNIINNKPIQPHHVKTTPQERQLKMAVLEDNINRSSDDGEFDFVPVKTNSIDEGEKVFKWMIAPYKPQEFLDIIWEKRPLHITRKNNKYYKQIISTPLIDNMLRTENIQFTKNIDITSYTNGVRETHNPVGRAHPHVVWDYYLNNCSIRLLNPQTYLPNLHLMNATLQEFFNSFVGANAYLTPPDSQGFAPHYDDIEAFILQVEGKKHWKVYLPTCKEEILPRVSSRNFDQNEIGKPLLEVTLEAGDMLYFPRGYIHQAETVEGEHSLHITVSMYQKHSWADLFEKMIPAALQAAINDNVELRQGLPLDIYDNFGLVNRVVNTPRKRELTNVMKSLCDKIKDYLPFDAGVDEMAKNYQQDALPPVLNDEEKCVTVMGDSDVMLPNGKVAHRVEIGLETRVRLLRRNILRMVSEETGVRLYYHVENSLEYHGNELQYLEIDEKFAPAIDTLMLTYPKYLFVENLGLDEAGDMVQVASDLWERGLLMTEYPLDTIEDD